MSSFSPGFREGLRSQVQEYLEHESFRRQEVASYEMEHVWHLHWLETIPLCLSLVGGSSEDLFEELKTLSDGSEFSLEAIWELIEVYSSWETP